MQKLSYVSNDEIPEGWTSDNVGSYNVAPIGWTEMPLEEFTRSRFRLYSPTYVDFRQLHRTIDGQPIALDDNGRKRMVQCYLYFYPDGSGYAMETLYWEQKINFYRFGCDHNMQNTNEPQQFRCMATYQCSKCGYRETVDSSD